MFHYRNWSGRSTELKTGVMYPYYLVENEFLHIKTLHLSNSIDVYYKFFCSRHKSSNYTQFSWRFYRGGRYLGRIYLIGRRLGVQDSDCFYWCGSWYPIRFGIALGNSTGVGDILATFPLALSSGETYAAISNGILSGSGYSPLLQ